MTALVDTCDPVRSARPDAWHAARTRFPARPVAVSWPATEQPRHVVEQRLTAPPFISEKPDSQRVRAAGVRLLLDWLTDQPGESWQQRWAGSGADPACGGWRRVAAGWLRTHGGDATWRVWSLSSGLLAAIGADVIRPSMTWVVSGTTAQGGLVRVMSRGRDVEGFGRLRARCDADPDIAEQITKLILNRSAEILAAKGGFVDDITIGDVLELLDTEREVNAKRGSGAAAFYRICAGRESSATPRLPHCMRCVRPTGSAPRRN